jgi:hypothetical protein
MNKINFNPSAVLGLSVLVLIVVGLQYYRINYLAPAPEYIWDNIYLWSSARSFGHGDFSSFLADSHHQLRWANWGFAAVLIKLFSDEIVIYYLSTIIPSTLAILIFTYLAWREVGWFAALAFIVLWFFDALLFRATFQLLPSGSALLPLAVLVALCVEIKRKEQMTLALQILTAITVFWLYGTKETHLAYFPGALWLIYTVGGIRPIIFICGALGLGYVGETVMFMAMNSDFSWLGRVHAVMNGGQHVQLMTEEARYVAQQTRFFDSGITMRWVYTSGVTPIAIFLGYIFALLSQVGSRQEASATEAEKSKKLIRVLSVMILSFLICNTFFIIQIDPIRLGQPLVPRYATTLMPMVYLLIVAFLAQQSKGASWLVKVGLLATIPFYIAPGIHRYSEYRTLSIFKISNDYHEFSRDLTQHQCVRAKQRVILRNQLDLVLEQYRTPRVSALIGADIPAKSELIPQIVMEPPWFVAKPDANTVCSSVYTIHRDTTMRY